METSYKAGNGKVQRYLLVTAAVILLTTALLKLIGLAIFEGSIGHDPLCSFLTIRQTLSISVCLELSVALSILTVGPTWVRAGLLAWLATLFVTYRLGLWWVHYNGPCRCAGPLSDWMPGRTGAVRLLTKAAVGYLLAAGYGMVIHGYYARTKGKNRETDQISRGGENPRAKFRAPSAHGLLKWVILPLVLCAKPPTVAADWLHENPALPPFIRVDLEMEGITYSRSRHREPSTNVYRWSASVVLGPETWRIESGMPRNAEEFYFCDGTNVYYSTEIHSNPHDSASPMKTVDFVGANNNVVVIPGTHPMGDFGANLLWLAYCSGSYLQSTNRLLPLPGAEVRHDIESFAVEARTALSDMPPFLPNRIAFHFNKENARRAAESLFPFRSVTPFSPRVSGTNGLLRAVYQVERFTNYSGWTVPSEFTYLQSLAGADLVDSIRYRDSGKLTRISKTAPPKPILENGKPQFVEDTRFRHAQRLVDSLRYWHTNGPLPATNDPTMLAAVQNLANNRPVVGRPAPQFGRLAFMLLLLLITAAPLAFLTIRWRLKRRRVADKQTPTPKDHNEK